MSPPENALFKQALIPQTIVEDALAAAELSRAEIPAGVEHNVFNMSDDLPLRLYTLYSPPEHPAVSPSALDSSLASTLAGDVAYQGTTFFTGVVSLPASRGVRRR